MSVFFSNQQRSSRYLEGAKKFTFLTPEEQITLNEILLEHIKTYNERYEFSLHQTDRAHQNYIPKKLLLKFYLKSPEFAEFMENTELPHLPHWQQRLKDAGYLYFNIISVDKNEPLSIAKHYLVSYLHQYCEEHKNVTTTFPETIECAQDLACTLGSFYYLDKRCIKNLAKLKTSWDDLQALGQFLNDARRLGNLYGTYGYVVAALKLWDLCTHYDNPDLDDAQKTTLHGLYKITMEYFLRAIILFENTENVMNQKIFCHYTRNEGFKHFVKVRGGPIYFSPETFESLSDEAANKKILTALHEKLFQRFGSDLVQSLRTKASVNVYKVEELVNFLI